MLWEAQTKNKTVFGRFNLENLGQPSKETHFAFLGLNKINGEPLTILKWQELHRAWFRSYQPGAWCAEEKFATEQTCAFRWYLMLLEIVPNSTNKTFQEQTAMLPADYEVPLAIEEVTKLILYRRKNSVFLNRLEHGRCQDTIFGCYPVSVGGFSSRGFHITRYWDSGFYYGVGLAASRKLWTLRPSAIIFAEGFFLSAKNWKTALSYLAELKKRRNRFFNF